MSGSSDYDKNYSRYSARDKLKEYQLEKERKKQFRNGIIKMMLIVFLSVILLVLAVIGIKYYMQESARKQEEAKLTQTLQTEFETESESESEFDDVTPAETEIPDPDFEPHAHPITRPSNMIEFTDLEINGMYIDNVEDYPFRTSISFESGRHYTDADGIITFRGNNFRDTASYGTAALTENSMTDIWSVQTGALTYNNSTWSGSGWTGQPLIMRWPSEVKKHMNLYPQFQDDPEFVEVIYACMDGYIYFLDLKTGEKSRDSLYLGYTFKGSGALDPRGYPIMYLGAGYDSVQGKARAFIINLLDCSVMYTFGNGDEFSLRGNLSFFDASALVDAETDTLIYPGENGLLYLIRLNSRYDSASGEVSIDPDPVIKWRYKGLRSGPGSGSYWLGMEDSPAIYKGFLFIADNGGHLFCLNLNTLELVWVKDILDDSNSTPVLALEDDHLYLYISTSFHLGWRSHSTASIPVWKIDAEDGSVVWKQEYECHSMDGVSGGVQSTIALGREQLSDSVFVTVSMTGNTYSGILACLDRETGEVKWEHAAYYAWSSPVCVYREDGSGVVLYCSGEGILYMLDAKTGAELSTIRLSDGVIEASPAVYEDIAVIGTRACKIWGIQLN